MMMGSDNKYKDLLDASQKALAHRDRVEESIRRYLEGRLFVYFDQLEKKENLVETFQNHMVILAKSLKNIISVSQVNQWIEKISSLNSAHLAKHKEIAKVKEEIESFFDDDFFALFDEIDLEEVSSIGNVIDGLFIENVNEKEPLLSKNVDRYLEQFLPKEHTIADDEKYKAP